MEEEADLPNQFLQAELTAEMIIAALLKSPDIISAEFKNGLFYVVTTAGSKNFKINFLREPGSGTA